MTQRDHPAMGLWRLEWLRLVRTRRLVALVGVYLFFGFTGPLLAYYLPDLLDRFGEGIVLELPELTPPDGIAQYTSNANQIGLLVAVVVVAGALVLDAVPEMSVFLRTRVSPVSRLLWPRLVVSLAVSSLAVVVGTAAAWYETAVLIGALDAEALLAGTALTIVYTAFVVALVAAVGSRTGSILATVATTVVVLLVLPLAGIVDPVGRWLPSHLLGASDGLLRQTETLTEYLPAAAVTLLATVGLVALAFRWAARREV